MQRDEPIYSVSDPALADFLGLSGGTLAGVNVTEKNALSLAPIWRSVSLIAGTLAGLPLKTYRRVEVDGRDTKERIRSFFDDGPHPNMTQFAWTELCITHLALYGNLFLRHIHGGAGQVVALQPIIPSAVHVEEADNDWGKTFKVSLANGTTKTFTPEDMTHVLGLTIDGIRGISPVAMARQSLGALMAADQAAARQLGSGMMLGGVLSPKSEDLTAEQGEQVRSGLQAKSGARHAGDLAWIPAAVDFKPWAQTNEDSQWIESRHFGIEECGRWLGCPRELLSESGASSWGSGIQELVRAWQKFTLSSYTSRLEQALSALLPKPQFVEWDYSGLLQPDTTTEIELLLRQVEGGLLTVDEARGLRNMAPLPPEAPQEPQERPKLEEVA